jgi:hypothetical protein
LGQRQYATIDGFTILVLLRFVLGVDLLERWAGTAREVAIRRNGGGWAQDQEAAVVDAFGNLVSGTGVLDWIVLLALSPLVVAFAAGLILSAWAVAKT